MMSRVKLTYIVPIYNTEPYVARCLRSLFEQGLAAGDFEVIVVDDGSTDGGKTAVKRFSHEHPQVRLLTQEHAGVSAARNWAIDNARGDYIQFVDSDDYLLPGVMTGLLRRAIDQDLDLLEFNYSTVNGLDDVAWLNHADSVATTQPMAGCEFLKSHALTPYIWRFLFKRNFLNEGKYRFDRSLIACEDGTFMAQAMLGATRVSGDAAAPYCYVRRNGSAMRRQDVEHLRRRVFSQVDAAAMIDAAAKRYETATSTAVPASVTGLRNVYLYFSMTKALTCGMVSEVTRRIRQAGLFPFPCIGPEANYHGAKWKVIHALMMRPGLWNLASKFYRMFN